MCHFGRLAKTTVFQVCCNQIAAEVDVQSFIPGMHLQLLSNVLMWNRVVVIVVLNVIVDIDLDLFDVNVLVGLTWQSTQGRSVQSFERLFPVSR